jgi:peptide/nickel transport system permease protein
LPAIVGPVLVLASLDIGRIILIMSGLSFLELGAQAPAPGGTVGEGMSRTFAVLQAANARGVG